MSVRPAFASADEHFTAVPAATLRAWLNGSSPGAQAIYASGADLPRDAESVRLAAQWQTEGLVRLHNRRDPGNPGRLQFLIVKLDPDAGRKPVLHAVDREEKARMLELLAKLGSRGKPCPSNQELAQMLALRNRRVAQYLLDRLEAEGRISIESHGRNAPRVVTIHKRRGMGR